MNTPTKGDKVRLVLEGTYSHQATLTGRHVIKLDEDDQREMSVPPDTELEVMERYCPPRPREDQVVLNKATGVVYQPCGLGCCWGDQSRIPVKWLTWKTLLEETNNGQNFVYYRKDTRPADKLGRG